jgi:CDP-glucose 4,6-dehydratase
VGLGDPCRDTVPDVPIDSDFWMGRRVLLTGHTGFKGAWTALWLQGLGAEVTGLSAGPPTEPSLYALAGVGSQMAGELAVDVRHTEEVREAISKTRPEIVLHLAAQPLVRRSLRDPAMTYEVNVMGTVNVLEAVRLAGDSVRAVVVVTSDKCYANSSENPRQFVEGDPLGGSDPYSSSKACAELVTAAYRDSFFSAETAARVASARAGNVIGGGDWGQDRLIADIVRGIGAGESVKVRNPGAVRPWQHVLNPLSGYLRLAEELYRSGDVARAWNFGPRERDARTVGWIVERLGSLWGGRLKWELDQGENPPEAGYLALDSTAAGRDLEWSPAWDLEQALERIVEWHEAQGRGEDMRQVSLAQIESFAGFA